MQHSGGIAHDISTLDAQPAARCPHSRHDPLRRPWTLIVVLLAAAVTVIGCSEKKISDRDLVMVDPSEAMELVGSRQRLLGLASDKTGVWVDPRGDRAYREGHIPGAISLPFQNVTTDRRKLEGYDVLIVYGDDYKDALADAMSKRLMELGFKDVRTLRGGIRRWTEAGHELETGDG